MIGQGRTFVAARNWPMAVWDANPYVSNAVRASIAGAIAWGLTFLLPAPLSESPFYAPMGAVLAISTNPAASVRTAMQAAGAITLGGTVAILLDMVADARSVLVMALAVLISMLLSGWKVLGTMGSWVPTAAIFALLVGGGETEYVWVYAAVVWLGALVAILVTLVTPGQPLVQVGLRLDRVRTTLIARIDDCIRELEDPNSPVGDDDRGVQRRLDRAHEAMRDVGNSRRGNLRVRRRAGDVSLLQSQLRAWSRVNSMVGVIIDYGTVVEPGERVIAHEVSDSTVLVLRRLSEVITATRARANLSEIEACREAVDDLRRQLEQQTIPWSPVASSVVLMVGAALDDLTPRAVDDIEDSGDS